MTEEVPLGTVGLIQEGQEAGRYVEVVDDTQNTGGYLIYTYASADRSPEVYDNWVQTLNDIKAYFRESGWRIAWHR